MKSLDGVLIKRANSKVSYGEKELIELARCMDPKTGPMHFLTNYFYIQHPIHQQMLFDPYDFQIGLIESYINYRFSINLLSRQLGKSTTAAGYLLWYGMFVSDSTILIASHQYSGVQEIMHRIRYAYELCPDHIRAGVTSYNKGSIEFDNGSRIIGQATTEKTGRGLSISLLYLDEFAFVRPTIAKEFWASMRPTLATGGKAIITSTPNSDEDQFANLWHDAIKTEDEFGNTTELGVNGFKAYEVDWRAHPDRDEKWAEEELSALGYERFQREHENKFFIADETLIAAYVLERLEGKEPQRKEGEVRWYADPKPGMIYTVALDPSLGTGGDYAAIQVFEANTSTQIAEWKNNKTTIPAQIKLMSDIINYIADTCNDDLCAYYSIENNTIGEAALISIEEFGEENIKGIFLSEPKTSKAVRFRKGFNTTNKKKLAACSKFKTMLEGKKLTIFSKPLVSELKHFIASGAGYTAKVGEHDDLIMATLLCIRMMYILRDFHKELSGQLIDYDERIDPPPFFAIL